MIDKSLLIKSIPLIFSICLHTGEYENIDNVISHNLEGPLTLGYIHGKFDESLDVLNYADKLTSTKPKQATADSFFISYEWNNFKIAYETIDSSGEVTRQTHPKSLQTNVDSNAFYISYKFKETDKRYYDLGIFVKDEDQDPVTIDCYAFGATVVGGTCEEASLRLLDSDIYKESGELVYKPVLKTEGSSESKGLYLRLSPKDLSLFNFVHTLSYKISEVEQLFQSDILNTTDSFIRQLSINGQRAGDLLDNFKYELPQTTPWKENTFKYSLSNLYPIGNKFAVSSMYSFIKVKRKDYLENPTKKDFNKNHLLDISFLYQIQKNSILYLKLSASSNYLLGENPLAYNRKSNHLFDHPYGQVYAGLLFNF